MSLTGATIQEILYTDNPNEGRVKINDNFKRLRYFLDEAASTYISTPGIGKTATSIDKEKPIGDIDGKNTIFTLKNKPVDGSDHVYLNGVLQENGQDLDYILKGKDIVFILPPLTGMRVICSYRT